MAPLIRRVATAVNPALTMIDALVTAMTVARSEIASLKEAYALIGLNGPVDGAALKSAATPTVSARSSPPGACSRRANPPARPWPRPCAAPPRRPSSV
jgi:hypothetical protein